MNSEISGVAFSRHPLKPLSSDCVFIESVFGLGEGLVGGELEADSYEVLPTVPLSVYECMLTAIVIY